MSSAELPEGLGELPVWGLDSDGCFDRHGETIASAIARPHPYELIILSDLLAWARPLQARLKELEDELEEAHSDASDAVSNMRRTIAETEEHVRSGIHARFDLLAERMALEAHNISFRDSTPGARERRDASERPEPGDLVVRTDGLHFKGDRLGVCVLVNNDSNDHIVKNLATGVEESWGNAKFVRVLEAKELSNLMEGRDPDPLQAKLEAAEALIRDMAEIGERLGTQDNRITSDPIFMVQEHKRTYGVSEDYTDQHVWLDPDDREAGVLDEEEEGAVKVGYTSHWESIQACLTEVGAQAFIDRKAHDYGPLRIYVASAYYNAEWRLIRGVFARAAGLGAPVKCITFDRAAQDAIPQEVRRRMDADRANAEGQGGSDA